ncbi:RNI-like protein [Plenodomus tracheiphilus IPT5]|uniref:RNI-like protein n=1 Tax=Plenodomus tracheiphilus IPT5 TaxID=1408161 RepID=A0A6A7ASZ5_9PLEO|nr:RNI-like protein [Plenodomus tracheiphilus IPT5]
MVVVERWSRLRAGPLVGLGAGCLLRQMGAAESATAATAAACPRGSPWTDCPGRGLQYCSTQTIPITTAVTMSALPRPNPLARPSSDRPVDRSADRPANMTRARRRERDTSASGSDSSASTSPERGFDDDKDSIMMQSNDSLSSLAPSVSPDSDDDARRRAIEEQHRVSPISRLPAELMIAVFAKLSSPNDLKNCMLVSTVWARNSVGLLWHRPSTNKWSNVKSVIQTIRTTNSFFDYSSLIKRLNLSTLGNEVSDGTLQPLSSCKRVERLTLTNCSKLTDLSLVSMLEDNRSLLALDVTNVDSITDKTMFALAQHAIRLQGLNITNCKKITDESLEAVAKSCRHLKRLKLNGCSQLSDKSIIAFALHCRYILEIDLHDCKNLDDDSITTLITEGPNLRELRLAHCWKITDQAFLRLPSEATYDCLRILDLTDCGELQDSGVQKIIYAAPRLRNLVLAKCRNITDRAVLAITRLGKNLHYIHLGHCSRITDTGVAQLVKQCNRIRYIDLACCTNLTDASVTQLATLPKLKRIGLVKCAAITDRSIWALAKPKQVGSNGPIAVSVLERVHLSYCTNLTLQGIHALLNNCPRLTHLSLTGVQAFLRDDLLVFCREAPPEFNEHQRDVFCVFSGVGVQRLRVFLNTNGQHDDRESSYGDNEGTMYNEAEDGDGVVTAVTAQAHGMAIEEGEGDMDEDFGNDSEMAGQD